MVSSNLLKSYILRYPTDFECWATITFSGAIFSGKQILVCDVIAVYHNSLTKRHGSFSTSAYLFILVVKTSYSDQERLRNSPRNKRVPVTLWQFLPVIVDIIQTVLLLLIYSFVFSETKLGHCTCIYREKTNPKVSKLFANFFPNWKLSVICAFALTS